MPATETQNHSYGECLRYDRKRFDMRRRGRAGYLSAAEEADHAAHHQVIEAAVNSGVCFDREAFQ